MQRVQNKGMMMFSQGGSVASNRPPNAKQGLMKRSERPQSSKPQRATAPATTHLRPLGGYPLGKEEFGNIYEIVSELVAATVFTRQDEVPYRSCARYQ